MPNIAHQQRIYASTRKLQLHREYDDLKKQLDYYNSELAVSAACEQIALEAALSAVTLGAAGVIGRRLASAAIRSESIIVNGRAARTLGVLATRSPGVTATAYEAGGLARRLQITRVACMTLGRLSAALLQQPVRMVIGQDFTWQGLAVGLLTAVGVPGPGTDGWVKATSSGAIASWQGANVILGTLAKGLPAYSRTNLSQSRDYLALVNTGVDVPSTIQAKSDELSKATVDYAKETEGPLGRDTASRVQSQDFSGKVPFLARHLSNAPQHVRNYTSRLTAISAQYQLWSGVYQNLVTLERATMTAKNALPVTKH